MPENNPTPTQDTSHANKTPPRRPHKRRTTLPEHTVLQHINPISGYDRVKDGKLEVDDWFHLAIEDATTAVAAACQKNGEQVWEALDRQGASARTEALKTGFLAAYRRVGVIAVACDAVTEAVRRRVRRQLVYEWKEDPEFAANMERAKDDSLDVLVYALRKRGIRHDSVAGFFILKGEQPEKWRETAQADWGSHIAPPVMAMLETLARAALGQAGSRDSAPEQPPVDVTTVEPKQPQLPAGSPEP